MITPPPPLSKQIKLFFEKELGGPLFERGYHEVRLSPLGQRLIGPAREILRQVEEFKTTAVQGVRGLAPIRVSATAYAPSDLLTQLESVLATLPEPTQFDVPGGSAAEVTAKLIAGHAELGGLIHLPASDKRLRYTVLASYQAPSRCGSTTRWPNGTWSPSRSYRTATWPSTSRGPTRWCWRA